jgi:hypothetical protein
VVATLQVRFSRVGFLSFCVFLSFCLFFFKVFFLSILLLGSELLFGPGLEKQKEKEKTIFSVLIDSELDQCLVTKPRSDPKKFFCSRQAE